VTSQVILDAPCDVLVVKRPCNECTGSYQSLLVPYDGSEFSKKALTRAAGMAKEEGGQVTVLYVIPRYEEMMEFYRSDSIKKSLHAEAEKILGEAKKIAAGLGITIRTEVREDMRPMRSWRLRRNSRTTLSPWDLWVEGREQRDHRQHDEPGDQQRILPDPGGEMRPTRGRI